MLETKNCIIESTYLGYDVNNIFTFALNLKGDGWTAQYGLVPLFGDEISNSEQILVDLFAILQTNSWESLTRMPIRVTIDFEEKKVVSIGHLIEDSWFNIDAYRKEIKEEVES